MARAISIPDTSATAADPHPGEWQALRGELVALLDQVEGRYVRPEPADPAYEGLSERVRNLRDQVGPEPTVRRREALRTVKRAVDRFSERDETVAAAPDALSSAIAEIRSRQFSAPIAALGRRPVDMPEFRELTGLVTGLSGRLEHLEVELKSQRASNGSVREVASQVEQLTHVVELLAGAVGETGQVKRLETQIAALAQMVGDAPQVDLSAINARLDDVAGTVGKLAELQAQQMEREIVREDRNEAREEGKVDTVAPAMQSIEKNVRNVYDRIDAIEKSVALSGTDFERLTSEMAAFTQTMREREAVPSKLAARIEALAAHIGSFESANGDVAGLKDDITALREAVIAGMEPRFNRIESRIEALADKVAQPVQVPVTEIENQLKLLMSRMDETGAQLDGLAKLYSAPEEAPDYEALATIVAERTSEAMTRRAPAPVAMFGADSLKSIEDRVTSMLRGASKGPDYEAIATLVAEKTSIAVASKTSAPAADANIEAFEKRMTALLNTAGKDTAERLARLETAFNERQDRAAAKPPVAKADVAPVVQKPVEPATAPGALDAMLVALSDSKTTTLSDAMPTNPADDAPLTDPGFKDAGPVRAALDAKTASRAPATAAAVAAIAAAPTAAPVADKPTTDKPIYDASSVERPPRPLSSFADLDKDSFAFEAIEVPPPSVELPPSQSSTSTFVAAARRAQRAKSEAVATPAAPNSLIGRALSRVMPATGKVEAGTELASTSEAPTKRVKPAKAEKPAQAPKIDTVAAPIGLTDDSAEARPGFLTRHRRPILLAATLVAVSLLALNLVMQRVAETNAESSLNPETITPEPTPAPVSMRAQPTASDATTALVAPQPRVIEMVDGTATGSINSPAAAGFAKPPAVNAAPPALTGTPAPAATLAALDAPMSGATMATDAPATGDVPAAFELPPEAVGPLDLRQAAANGDARAQFEIAAIYTEGRAVPQDYSDAAIWYERSAAQGFVPAQYRLGNLYEAGNGVEKDLENARLWYQRGAEAGNRMAMHNLAALHAGGEMGEQEFGTAAEWFEQAANLGMTDSQFNLGMLYARGLGVEQDMEQSYKWFTLAARNGDDDALKARDDIAGSLSPEIVARLNGEIDAWRAQPIDLAANFAPIGSWSNSFDPGETITTREVIAKVQVALGKLGYDVGTPDGLSGPKTADAIRSFERGTGMAESGVINPRLLAVLGSQPV